LNCTADFSFPLSRQLRTPGVVRRPLPTPAIFSDPFLLADPDISKLNAAQLNKQLDLVEGALKKILGIKPRFVRAPYGSHNPANIAVLKNRGYVLFFPSLFSTF
jgi:hypothetical protein